MKCTSTGLYWHAGGQSRDEVAKWLKALSFQQWNQTRLDEVQNLPFESAGKDEEPIVWPGVFGPGHFPVSGVSKKVVLPYAVLERALQCHGKEEV
jgi:hypothetical protein